MVQVDYARVVDLDVGASKSDICAIKKWHHFGVRRQNSSLQPRVGFETKALSRPATDR
jgi:hypothetical protein